MKVYTVSCKQYYTDGAGLILQVFSTKRLAVQYIKQLAPRSRYNKSEGFYEDDDSQTLYEFNVFQVFKELPQENTKVVNGNALAT